MADDNDSHSSTAEGKRETHDKTSKPQASVKSALPEQKASESEPRTNKRQPDKHPEEPLKKRREKKSAEMEPSEAEKEPANQSSQPSNAEPEIPQALSVARAARTAEPGPAAQGLERLPAAFAVSAAGEDRGLKRQLDASTKPTQPTDSEEDAKRRKQERDDQERKAAELAAAKAAQDLRDARRERIQERILLKQLDGNRKTKERVSPDGKAKKQQQKSAGTPPAEQKASQTNTDRSASAPAPEPRRIAFEVRTLQEAKKSERTSGAEVQTTHLAQMAQIQAVQPEPKQLEQTSVAVTAVQDVGCSCAVCFMMLSLVGCVDFQGSF